MDTTGKIIILLMLCILSIVAWESIEQVKQNERHLGILEKALQCEVSDT